MNKAVRSTLSSLVNPQFITAGECVDARRTGPVGWGCDKLCKHQTLLLLFVPMLCFLTAWWPQGLAVSSWQEGSLCPLSKVRTSPLQRWLTPTLALGVPPYPSKGGKLCFLRSLLMACLLWGKLDPSWPPRPAQESACVVFTLSGLPMGPALVAKHYTGSHMEWVCR